MKQASMLILLVLMVGCSDTRIVQRQPTQNDPPFGGGFPSSHQPGGSDDPRNANLRRGEIRTQWRGDNGAPETRIDGGNPDSRLSR